MSMFENFTTFNFNEGVPYVTVTKNGVAFNKGVIMKLFSKIRFCLNDLSDDEKVIL